MRVIEPSQFRRSLRKKRHTRGLLAWSLLFLTVVYAGAAYLKPLPAVQAHVNALSNISLDQPSLVWPRYGQAAIGATGYGVLAAAGAQGSAPIASVAKIVTALTVLKAK